MRKLFLTAIAIIVTASAAFAAPVTPLPEETVYGETEKEDTSLLSPGTVSVVKPGEMRGEHKNLPELLKQVPGLHVVEAKGRGAYTVASVRGSTAAEVSVFVDGTLMNLGSEAAVDLSTIPVENVERIEVYRGYIPARFAGASMGGVINIITKKQTKPGGSLSVGVGSYGNFETSLSYGMPLGDGNFFFGANYERADGDFEYMNDNGTPYNPEDDYSAKRQNNGYKNTDILMKWNNDNWSVRGAWKKNDRELPYSAAGADKPTSDKGALLNTDQYDFSVARHQKNGNLEWGWKLDYLEQDKVYDNPKNVGIGGYWESHNEYKTKRFGMALDGSLLLGENNLLEFMADYSNEKLDVDGDIIKAIGGISNFSRDAWNVQVQDTINLDKTGTFLLTPIIRYNASDGTGKTSWGVGLTKQIGESLTLKASGGTYNRAPNLYERYGDGAFLRPNQQLEWEDGTQWDIGADWKGRIESADVTASLTFFGRYSNNLIEYVMTSPRYAQYQNIGEARIYGVEFENTIKWGKWDSHFSATWMDTENTTENDYRNGAPLPNRPEWEGMFRLSRLFLDDKLSAYIEANYTAKNYYDEAGHIVMDNYFTMGLGMKYLIRDGLKIVIGVDDIFDNGPDLQMVTETNGPERMMWYPLQGRSFYASVIWEF